jgi:hypothetical protein
MKGDSRAVDLEVLSKMIDFGSGVVRLDKLRHLLPS